jgi:hypothetical protein
VLFRHATLDVQQDPHATMGSHDGAMDPVWDDTDKLLGQLFMMGFEGTTVTPQVSFWSASSVATSD